MVTKFGNKKNSNNLLLKTYFRNQIKTGKGSNDYFKSSRIQKGHGLGSVLGSLFRVGLKASKPFLKKGLKSVAKTALSTGADIAGDLIEGRNFKNSAKKHASRAFEVQKKKAVRKLKTILVPPLPNPRPRKIKPRNRKNTNKRVKKRKRRSDNFGVF